MTINRLLNLPEDISAMPDKDLVTALLPFFPDTRPGGVGNIAVVSATTAAVESGSAAAALFNKLKAESEAKAKSKISIRPKP